MPNWSVILGEIQEAAQDGNTGHDAVRRKYLNELHNHTGRNVIAYYSGFLTKIGVQGIQINDEDKNGFMACVHKMDRSKGLDLILHTGGGSVTATESIVHYLKRMFGNDIRAIVPQIAMSAGTMLVYHRY